ncbi:MAG: LysM peptidoglycan-binding domain-containing protein [Anditalea sp.]
MKKTVLITLFLNFLLVFISHSQELMEFLNAHEINEEVIMPMYDFEHIPDFTYDEVKQRVDEMSTEMSFELNETIFSFINYFTVRNRDYSRMVLARKDIYLPLFEEALKKHQMPDDIKYLAIIESGLNPRARSRVGAMGLWQFMPATGREYKLFVNNLVDDRMDPELATEAALKYLKALHRMFGDWEVALAAYNCGPGNVRKAIRRSGGKKTFWGIYNHLPRETRSYIPQFQAIMYVLRYAEEHNLILEEPTFPMTYEKVIFEKELDLEHFAEISGICIEDLEQLNPSILDGKVPSSHTHYGLRIPKAKARFFAENKEWIVDSLGQKASKLVAESIEVREKPDHQLSGKITYRIRPGDALGTIAQRYNTTIANLKEWNGLRSNTIKAGQELSIYPRNADFGANVVSNSTDQAKKNNAESKIYTVQPGDSLWLISRRMEGITIDQIKKLNNLSNNKIKPGQKLIIG